MTARLALALAGVCLTLAGCDRFKQKQRPRPQPKPFARTPAPAPPPGAAAPRPQLAISGPTPGTPPPPPSHAEMPLVPPAQTAAGTTSPGEPSGVVPAGGALPAVGSPAPYADADGQIRRQPRPTDLPSPFAAPQPPPAAGPAGPAGPADNAAQLRRLLQAATQRWQGVDTYECLLTRREVVGDKANPQEEVRFQFRKEPFSVHMLNVGKVGKGREILYVMGRFEDKMHVVTGDGDAPWQMRTSLSPDDSRAKGRSRHSIREAGFGNSINRFVKAVAESESGALPADAVRYAGPARRDDYPNAALVLVVRTYRPGEDRSLPTGGVRKWYFDADPASPGFGFPVVVTLHDGANKELEYYHFSQIKLGGLTDASFHPDRLKKK